MQLNVILVNAAILDYQPESFLLILFLLALPFISALCRAQGFVTCKNLCRA